MSSETIIGVAGTEISSEEKELHLKLRMRLKSYGLSMSDQSGNQYGAIPVQEVVRILLQNADDILSLANEIRTFREQDKYSCVGCALAEGDWCNADEECRRNFKDDALPDLYVPVVSQLNEEHKNG